MRCNFIKNILPIIYLALSRTGRINEENYIQTALELAAQNELPVVATNDICFLSIDDFGPMKFELLFTIVSL